MPNTKKFWLDPELQAPNVIEVDVPQAVLDRLQPCIAELRGEFPHPGKAPTCCGYNLDATAPEWQSDVQWLSQGDRASYAYFKGLFDEIGLADRMAPYVDLNETIRLYSGFFVTRSQCVAPDFHLDWIDGGNQAFTFLAPISGNCSAIPLRYRTFRGEEADYHYQLGRGLVFGDYFSHSTGIGAASEPVVLLSFTFGTDRMEDWPKLARTAGSQGRLHCRPDGVFVERTES